MKKQLNMNLLIRRVGVSPGGDVMTDQKCVFMADVMGSGFVFMLVFMAVYFVLERLSLAPTIRLCFPLTQFNEGWALTSAELTFMLAFILQLSWIGGQVGYYKLRGAKITW